MRKTKLSLRLDLDLLTRARMLAQKEKMTLTQFITTALLRKVVAHEKPLRHGLLIVGLFTALLLTGCSGLAIRKADSVPAIAGKVTARVILATVTFLLSELAIDDARRNEREQRYVNALTPKEYEFYQLVAPRVFQQLGSFLGQHECRTFRQEPDHQPHVSQMPPL